MPLRIACCLLCVRGVRFACVRVDSGGRRLAAAAHRPPWPGRAVHSSPLTRALSVCSRSVHCIALSFISFHRHLSIGEWANRRTSDAAATAAVRRPLRADRRSRSFPSASHACRNLLHSISTRALQAREQHSALSLSSAANDCCLTDQLADDPTALGPSRPSLSPSRCRTSVATPAPPASPRRARMCSDARSWRRRTDRRPAPTTAAASSEQWPRAGRRRACRTRCRASTRRIRESWRQMNRTRGSTP